MNTTRDVYLYGHLADEIGPHFKLAANTVPRVLQLLECNFPGKVAPVFGKGEYEVIVGNPDTGMWLGIEDMGFRLGAGNLHFFPTTEGAKGNRGKGAAKIAIGVGLVAVAGLGMAGVIGTGAGFSLGVGSASLTISWSQILFTGITTILGGISTALSPAAKGPETTERPENKPSYFIDAPVNAMEQGGCVPLAIGRFRVGSVGIGGALTVQDYPVGATPPATSTYIPHAGP